MQPLKTKYYYYERKNSRALYQYALNKGWDYRTLSKRWGVSYSTVRRWFRYEKPVLLDAINALPFIYEQSGRCKSCYKHHKTWQDLRGLEKKLKGL